jgi:hypothetical protein
MTRMEIINGIMQDSVTDLTSIAPNDDEYSHVV